MEAATDLSSNVGAPPRSSTTVPRKRTRDSLSDYLQAPLPRHDGTHGTSSHGSNHGTGTVPPSQAVTSFRHVRYLVFSGYEIKPKYASPYPLEPVTSSSAAAATTTSVTGSAPQHSSRAAISQASVPSSQPVVASSSNSVSIALDNAEATKISHGPVPTTTATSSRASISAVSDELKPKSNPSLSPAPVIIPESPLVSPLDQPQEHTLATASSGESAPSTILPPSGHSGEPAPDSASIPSPALNEQGPSSTVPSAGPSPSEHNHNLGSTAATTTTKTTNAPRGHSGRFEKKPLEQTVRGRRALAKAQSKSRQAVVSAATAAVDGSQASLLVGGAGAGEQGTEVQPRLTQKRQRELKREAKARAAAMMMGSDAAALGQGMNGGAVENGHGPGPGQAQAQGSKTIDRLFVCEGCFKYMLEERALVKHQKECTYKHPPGRKVYERGAHAIWEVDGAVEKLWCQNLCLFGKLFIEHKYMFFDVEGFLFYVMTDATPSRDWPLAYFSKEKLSYDDYNLACIVTFTPYRQKGWATLLIEFSYELTRQLASTPGTPERPLSELGLRGYLAFWTSTIIRYFRLVLKSIEPSASATVTGRPRPDENGSTKLEETARVDVDLGTSLSHADASTGNGIGTNGTRPQTRGTTTTTTTTATSATVAKFRSPSRIRLTSSQSSNHHQDLIGRQVVALRSGSSLGVLTDLNEVARACHLRPDDVAFALVESGLAQWRRRRSSRRSRRKSKKSGRRISRWTNSRNEDEHDRDDDDDNSRDDDDDDDDVDNEHNENENENEDEDEDEEDEDEAAVLELVISSELIEDVAQRKGVRDSPMLDRTFVLL